MGKAGGIEQASIKDLPLVGSRFEEEIIQTHSEHRAAPRPVELVGGESVGWIEVAKDIDPAILGQAKLMAGLRGIKITTNDRWKATGDGRDPPA